MLNRKIKLFLYTLGIGTGGIIFINLYKTKYSYIKLNLNDIEIQNITNNTKRIPQIEDPFELINNFNFEDYELNRIGTALYNPPLTNKLYPRSNLYGHELIRYFDF
jgi:hypothetical protein